MRKIMRRIVGAVGIAAALTLLCGSMAWGAARPQEPERPTYALSNIVALVAAAVMLSIPCKRFRRT